MVAAGRIAWHDAFAIRTISCVHREDFPCPCDVMGRWMYVALRCPFPLADLGPHLIHGPTRVCPQTPCQSIRPVSRGSASLPTQEQAERPRYNVCNNSPLCGGCCYRCRVMQADNIIQLKLFPLHI